MSVVTVAVGDIHGRFVRLEQWLRSLAEALGRPLDAAFAVGDVETFTVTDDYRRRAAKRNLPAEFAPYATGERQLPCPMYFIGGNNEDFEALHGLPEGGEIAPGMKYLGRVGSAELLGLRIAWLSGIYALRFLDRPLLPPRSADTRRQAGYFRAREVEAAAKQRDVDLFLQHEWPRGINAMAQAQARGEPRTLKAHRFQWVGNQATRAMLAQVRPQWLWCGHSHTAFATRVEHGAGGSTRVACLDQSARPDAALLWVEWEGRTAVRAGWGTSGAVQWTAEQPWDERCTPLRGEWHEGDPDDEDELLDEEMDELDEAGQ